MVDRLRSVLSALGAILTGAGVLILLFVAYQLWGTGLYTSRQQDSLRSQFKQKAHIDQPAVTTSTTLDPTKLPPLTPCLVKVMRSQWTTVAPDVNQVAALP